MVDFSSSEVALLGAILLNNECYWEAAARVRAEDFSLDSHRRLFARMAELAEAGKPIDFISMSQGWAHLEAVGGLPYLVSLTDYLPRKSSVACYCDAVREGSRLRRLQRYCDAMLTRIEAPDVSSAECIGELQQELLRLEASEAGEAIVTANHCTQAAYEQLYGRATGGGELAGFSTGIETLDSFTTGIREHQLWILGGRQGEGKSCLATQVVVANASRGIPVLLITPEMSREQALERIWIQTSGVPARRYSKNRFSHDDLRAIARQAETVRKWPLFFDDSASITAQQISARTRLAVRRNGVRLLVVDYIQLVEAQGNTEREQVKNVSKCLRTLAKEVVPVLALSQMPRPRDGNLNRWPTKHDLMESGALESDAATVLMIFRKLNEKNLPTGEDYLVIPKQRFGPVGYEPVTFDEECLVFRPRASEPLP